MEDILRVAIWLFSVVLDLAQSILTLPQSGALVKDTGPTRTDDPAP